MLGITMARYEVKINSNIAALVVINRKTAELAEMTHSWFGLVIWLMEFNDIPEGTRATYPYLIYDDDKRFKDYDVIGEL